MPGTVWGQLAVSTGLAVAARAGMSARRQTRQSGSDKMPTTRVEKGTAL